jgi:SAM-dependent methyltransferase
MSATFKDDPARDLALDADAFWRLLVAAASASYGRADAHARRFARAKLSGDRVFRHVVENGLIAPGAKVVDVGCGQGLLASLLHAADAESRRGRWPSGWADAPRGAHVLGIDTRERDLARAVAALGDAASFVRADMRLFEFPPCDAVVFFDTLHYVAPAAQDDVLAHARAALRPGGVLLLRVGDRTARLRFELGLWIDRFTMLLHGGGFKRVVGRAPEAWTSTLERLGFDVQACRMNGRPPFANLLIVARRAPAHATRDANEKPRRA